ncbi:DEKNAAC102725 [Brettanomyces naardenensis]|uniref:DEKNAAC102725 n=1 Tax=Brettanomyces naardenensis TaxID=13370 RepID=A0A448YKN0_BRENA|nr:DEKNAAC102725 [Brettanomyces naardenensis]
MATPQMQTPQFPYRSPQLPSGLQQQQRDEESIGGPEMNTVPSGPPGPLGSLVSSGSSTPRAHRESQPLDESKLAEQAELKQKLAKTPWRKKRLYNSPFPRFSHAASATTSDSGALYLMGGLCGKNVFGDMWVIEPVKREDGAIAEDAYPYIASPIDNFDRMPAPRIGHACVMIGNAFIVFAGDTVTNSTQVLDNRLYFFNITSQKWTVTAPKGPRPAGRYGHQIAVLNFEVPHQPGRWLSYLYVFGGQLEDDYYADIWKFDLTNFRNPDTHWVKIAPHDSGTGFSPPPLADHTMTAFENKIYVYGGTDGHRLYNDLLCFDPLKEEWSKCPLHGSGRPPALQDHAATLYQNLLFIYGGKLEDEEPSSDLYVIDLKNFSCWKIISQLPYNPGARSGHSITVDVANEKLLIMGGDRPDRDFDGVYEDSSYVLDENPFNYPRSVIYEFNLQLLPKFMERSRSSRGSLTDGQLPELTRSPETIGESEFASAKSVVQDLDSPTGFHNVRVSPNSLTTSEPQFMDAKEDSKEQYPEDVPVPATPDNTVTVSKDVNANEAAIPAAIAAESTMISEHEVHNLVSSTPKSAEVIPQAINSQPEVSEVIDRDEKFANPLQTPIDSEYGPEVKTPERAPERPVMVQKSPERPMPTEPRSLEPTQSPSKSTGMHSNRTSSSGRTMSSMSNSAGRKDVMEASFSSANSAPDDGTKIQSMAAMLRSLKQEMQERVAQANDRIVQLEEEKDRAYLELDNFRKEAGRQNIAEVQLQSKEQEQLQRESGLTGTGDKSTEALGEVAPQKKELEGAKGTELNGNGSNQLTTKDRVRYENQILQLTSEKETFEQKLTGMDSYIKGEISKLNGLNGIIKSQQESISKLQSQIVGETELKKQMTELKSRNESIELELQEFKALYSPSSTTGMANGEKGIEDGVEANINPVQTLTDNVDKLLDAWSATPVSEIAEKSIAGSDALESQKDATVKRLQAQVDELLDFNKSEEDGLKSQLSVEEKKRKELESSYKQSVSSLNNTHRALAMSQTEIESLRDSIKKLNSELEDLKLKKRIPSGAVRSPSASHTSDLVADKDGEQDIGDNSEIEARYGFKIRDLEADLFIATQERDKLREELIALKKKMYNSPSLSAPSKQI